ncbi:MAG: hypothetical protein ACFFE1_17450 [Candidatus Thorarchaeota archaeon]
MDKKPALIDLHNLVKICQRNDTPNWATIIQEHFTNIIEFQKFVEEFERNIHDFNFVEEYLGVKLYPQSYLTSLSHKAKLYPKSHLTSLSYETLTTPYLEDVPQVLIFDLPTTIAPINKSQVEVWNKKTETLFEIGKQNIREKYDFDYTLVDIQGVEVYAIITDHPFSSNILFDIETMDGLLGTHGSLVGVPTRQETAIYPIEGEQVTQSMNILLSIILRRKQEGLGVTISDKLFWYHDGRFQTIPYEISGRNLDFYPPPEFIKLLDQLNIGF